MRFKSLHLSTTSFTTVMWLITGPSAVVKRRRISARPVRAGMAANAGKGSPRTSAIVPKALPARTALKV